jgi:hypothetical protein
VRRICPPPSPYEPSSVIIDWCLLLIPELGKPIGHGR